MARTAPRPEKPEPECCRTTGLIFPDRAKRCAQHRTATENALVTELDRSARPILGTLGWPYGADVDIATRQRLIAWATERGVTRARTQCQELHWLLTGRCNTRPCHRLGLWMDHVTRWSAHGGPALILAQPYGLRGDAVAHIGDLANTEELTFNIDGDGWYGYNTVAIEIWRTDAYDAWISGQAQTA